MCQHQLTHQHPQLKKIACPQVTQTQLREYKVHLAVNSRTTVYIIKEQNATHRNQDMVPTQQHNHACIKFTLSKQVSNQRCNQYALTTKKSPFSCIRHHIYNHRENHKTLTLKIKFQSMYAKYHRLALIFITKVFIQVR